LMARWPPRRRYLEASPSLVYGAALLMRLGFTAPPGFESRSLRRRFVPCRPVSAVPVDSCVGIGARSSTDRALHYRSRRWGCESFRGRSWYVWSFRAHWSRDIVQGGLGLVAGAGVEDEFSDEFGETAHATDMQPDRP